MILLDTHFVLWAALRPERLPARAAKAIGVRDTPVAFSVASLVEVMAGRASLAVGASSTRVRAQQTVGFHRPDDQAQARGQLLQKVAAEGRCVATGVRRRSADDKPAAWAVRLAQQIRGN